MLRRMVAREWHLAQLNIAIPRGPLGSPQLATFMELLVPINALADDAPGFVWRLQTETGDATGIRAFGDDRIIVNLSVWESLETLGAFAFDSPHRAVLKRRREWFERMAEAYVVLWWMPAGEIPSVEEAECRLDLLRARGASPEAFTFREPFPPAGSTEAVAAARDRLAPI